MRNIKAQWFCFCVFYFVYHALGVHGNKRDIIIDPALYKKIEGDWQGSLATKEHCSGDPTNCSYHLVFYSDYTFFLQVGVGCFRQTTNSCKNFGSVIDLTEDAVTLSYKCSPGSCFCETTNNTSVEFCYRYTKPTVMRLNVAMYRSPVALHTVCPAHTEVSCVVNQNDTEESVAVGYVECMDGACKVCDASHSCSNRGICNAQGTCDCFSSFLGPSCNISVCANSCSAHGICDMTKTKVLMGMPFFDESKRVGVCRCFSGWFGPDCSSPDIFSGRQKLWEGLIFIGIVSTVTALSILLRKFIYPPLRQRTRRSRRRRHRENRLEVEMEEFMNPL